jgi:hypothetical protein
MSDDAQDPFLHDPQAFERMIGEMARMTTAEFRHGWQPIETAPQDRDVLLWVPPSDMLSDLIAGHMEVGRGKADGRATHWLPLPEPPSLQPDRPHITCPRCGLTSFDPLDISGGWCQRCHDWTSLQPDRP